MGEISSDCGKISATTAGDKISTCANATQILKKASAPLNTNRADEEGAKDGANLNEDRLSTKGIDLTSDVPIAVSAKFSRPTPSEKRALACEQIVTSNALNASGTEGALAAIGATGASTTPAAISTIDTSNMPNLDGSFAATRAAKASAASYKNEPQAELKNELNRAAESQAELQNKSNSIKSQVGRRSELSHDELQAEHQGELNRAEQQWQGKPSRVKSQDEWQSEPSCAEPQDERQSKSCAAEPQDVLILLSLGAFDFPQQCFIRANASGTSYFIRHPLPTRENHAAHQKISEIFSQWQR